jgi:hypothetical protein
MHAQVRIPVEVSSLPAWKGEEAAAKLSPPHYVFRDANGQMVVYWASPEKPGHRVLYRFWLPNRVEPAVSLAIARSEESGKPIFVYDYTLRNAASAVSAIAHWSIVGPAGEEMTVTHPAWKGSGAKNAGPRIAPAAQALLPGDPNGAFFGWYAVRAPELSPGHELGHFMVRSRLLPGLTTAYAAADGVLEEPDGEFPDAVVQELIPLQRPYVWWKTFLTVGPRFAPGTPLPEIMAAFRKDMAGLAGEGLVSLDSAYIQEFMEALRGEGAPLLVKAPPQSPIEKDIERAFRMAVAAAR